MKSQKAKGPVVGKAALSCLLSVQSQMVKDPETFSFKLPAFQSIHSDSHSISLSVRQLVHHLVDIMILSEALMPNGYLCRLSHTLIYEASPICAGRGLIALFVLSFLL